jgi:hypothetical protein
VPHAEADRRGHQLLLGDVHLEVALGILRRELVGEGRVAHFPVHRHHVAAGADRGQRVAVGLAGSDLVADGVHRQLHLGVVFVRPGDRGRTWLRAAQEEAAFPAKLDDRALGHLRRERLAVPALPVLDLGETAALDGAGQDDRRLLAAAVARAFHGPVDLGQVMAVDGQDAGAERGQPPAVGVQIPGQVGRAALAEPVDIHHGDEVGQLVMRGLVEGFPDRALGHLAVAAQHPDPERGFVEVLAGQRDPDGVGQALPERAGGYVHPGQHGGRMSLQPGPEPAVPGHELLVRDDAHRLVDRVQQGRRVALGEDQVVVLRVGRLVPVVPEMPADEHGQQVRGRHAGGRVARPGGRTGPDGVNPQLLGELTRQLEINVRLSGSWVSHDTSRACGCADRRRPRTQARPSPSARTATGPGRPGGRARLTVAGSSEG